MHTRRKNWKVYREDVKEGQTTHWDLDYLTNAELEAVMAAGPGWRSAKPAPASDPASGIFGLIKRMLPAGLGRQA